MWHVYILLSQKYPKTYVGITQDVNKRLLEHNSGSNQYSKKYMPWRILYTEICKSKSIALRREKYFKSHAGRKYMKKQLFSNPR